MLDLGERRKIMTDMRRKCFILSGIGFLSGMLMGNLIAWLSGGTLVNTKIAEWCGSETGSIIIQTLLSGLLGAIAMGGVVIHTIESWSLLRCAVVHYLLIEISYVVIATILGWYGSLTELLIVLGIQLIVFAIIWLVMYQRCKAQVRELNELLAKNRTGKNK